MVTLYPPGVAAIILCYVEQQPSGIEFRSMEGVAQE